jgi:hypothetical protein
MDGLTLSSTVRTVYNSATEPPSFPRRFIDVVTLGTVVECCNLVLLVYIHCGLHYTVQYVLYDCSLHGLRTYRPIIRLPYVPSQQRGPMNQNREGKRIPRKEHLALVTWRTTPTPQPPIFHFFSSLLACCLAWPKSNSPFQSSFTTTLSNKQRLTHTHISTHTSTSTQDNHAAETASQEGNGQVNRAHTG